MAKETLIVKHSAGIWHLMAGIIMALLGIYIWFNPVETMVALAMYLGIIFVIVGFGYVYISYTHQSGWYLSVGILDVLVGFILLFNLGVTAVSLPAIFAIWCIAVGVSQISASCEMKKNGFPWGWSLISGILGIIFGVVILAYPILGFATITVLMGFYALSYGVVQILEYVYSGKSSLRENLQ